MVNRCIKIAYTFMHILDVKEEAYNPLNEVGDDDESFSTKKNGKRIKSLLSQRVGLDYNDDLILDYWVFGFLVNIFSVTCETQN